MRRLPLALLLLAPLPLRAAHTSVQSYTVAQGIPQAQVNALAQDGTGYLWVGTQAGGLGRYDGRRWKIFDATTGLPGSSINALVVDPEGRLVVATSGGAVRAEGDAFRAVGDGRTPVTALFAAPKGRVWLGTYRGLVVVPREGAAPVRVAGDYADETVLAIAADGAGGVWVGTHAGLGRVRDPEAPRLEAVKGLPRGAVVALLPRRGEGLLAAVGDAGVWEGEPGSFHRLGNDASPGPHVSCLAAEGDEAIWIGTSDRGAFRLRAGAFEPFGTAEGLLSTIVYAVLEDREGILWFGTDAGLTKRGPSAFLSFDEKDGFPAGQALYGAAQSRDGALWFNAWDAGLVRMARDGTIRRFRKRDGLPSDAVSDVAAHPDGGVWVATGKGLARIAGDEVTVPPGAKELPSRIRSLLPLPDGVLAVGSGAEGLAFLSRDGHVTRPKTPLGPDVVALFRGLDGTIWCGGDGWGARGLKPDGSVVVLTKKQGLPSDQVTCGLADAEGRLWLGTDRGAFCREPSGATRVVDRRAGLPDGYIYWVGQEPHGALWFGTNRGAARLSPGGEIEVYTARDGLGTDECNEKGFFVDAEGRVWITTVGASVFLGRPRPRRDVPPPVLVDEVLVAGRPAPAFGARALPPNPGPLTFRFAALSFADESAVRFRYRLSGVSEEWSETAPGQFETTWGGLPAGAYRFEVVARTADGRTSRAPAGVSFRIRAPWWRTAPALALAAGALLGGLAAFVRLRERRLVRARARLERLVKERTAALAQANERLAELAVTDELTSLANRRRILERLDEAISFARRSRTPLAVGIADLDRFKEINDSRGHAFGDRALVLAARAMARVLRTEDSLGRYGGEEFLVVLPGTDGPGAAAVAERMREALRTLPEDALAGAPLTVSVGIAAYDDPQLEAPELLRRADAALYAAKANGRDRVECWN